MVLPVSGFLPVPLPMMIPFMGAQSLVIGKMFGEGFQYGKRKISAMPNEEFNALTFQSMMSNARDEMQASILTMQQAMRDMQPMVETIIHEFTDYLSKVITAAPEQVSQISKDLSKVSEGSIGGLAGIIYEQFKNKSVTLVDVQKLISSLIPSLPEAGGHVGTVIPLVTESIPKKVFPFGWELAMRKQEVIDMAARNKAKLEKGRSRQDLTKAGNSYPISYDVRTQSGKYRPTVIILTFNEHKLRINNLRGQAKKNPAIMRSVQSYSTNHKKKTGKWI